MGRFYRLIMTIALLSLAGVLKARAFDADSLRFEAMKPMSLPYETLSPERLPTSVFLSPTVRADNMSAPAALETSLLAGMPKFGGKGTKVSIYDLPYSVTGRSYDWPRLWINTGVLVGAFVGTLVVLECLPEDATSWNRAELKYMSLGRRWHKHVIKKGPEWDHDKFIFNYVLHPYAGAAYFMASRSCGFNMWQSFLYCSLISNVGWEYGIEAFMERPSIQDLIITPVVGSAIGEGFYRVKRHLVANDYILFGSRVLGNIVAFFIDPVNEVVGLFAGNPARSVSKRMASERRMSLIPTITPDFKGFTFTATF